tara:strand:- start:90 stop:755 length:666 start_codon:yes stop_codon:yes gene_type:complete
MKFVVEIPARFGSKRVKNKNLKLLNGRPMISYAIEAAKNAKLVDSVYVNSEHEEIGKIALENGVEFYKRDPELAQDHITSDTFNYDFLKNIECDFLVMINPVSPLIEGEDIDDAISYYIKNKFDTMISVREEQLQAFCNNMPINFDHKKILPMTQNLRPIQLCSWAICIWNKSIFINNFREKGHAVFSGKYGFYKLDKIKSLKISEEIDFKMAEIFLNAKS